MRGNYWNLISQDKRIAMALDVSVGVNNLEEAAKLYTHFQNREVS